MSGKSPKRSSRGTSPKRTKRAEPQTFRARGLNVSLTVADLAKSVAWYRDVLGFVVSQEWGHDGKIVSVEVKAGTVAFVLNQDDGAKGLDRVKGQGLSLWLGTAQNVDDLAARVKSRGGALASEPETMPWGSRIFRVRDPDGFTLVITSGH